MVEKMGYNQRKKRDVGIELARVVACLIVIGVHVSLNDMETGVYSLTRGFINCLLADGVAIFWLITGCFLFQVNNYRKILIRTIKTVAIPIALLQFFCIHFSALSESGGGIYQSIIYAVGTYGQRLKDALHFNPTIPATGHLWYCYTYILVMIAFPVLYVFVMWLEKNVQREKWFCIITLLLLGLNDCSFNQVLQFSHQGINALLPATIQVIWGHILYRHREKIYRIKNKNVCIAGVLILLSMLNFVRMQVVNITGDKSITYWYTVIGLFCAISLITVCMIWSRNISENTRHYKIIIELASCTFGIYLIHLLVRIVLYRFRINKITFKLVTAFFKGFWGEIIYTLIFILITFGVSLCIIEILHLFLKTIRKWRMKHDRKS